ncbi:MAG: CBS domain-containing protein [Proteobacteria bacterium]|nr:CBS domain-containing protein [Pseudomonadota bacterium]
MLRSVKVRDHMIRRPVLVHPETELFEAIHQILRHKISGVTVIDENRKTVGMLSELDCLKAILSATYYQEEVGTIPVSDHMSPNVECVSADEDIILVAQSMLEHKHRRRPVVDDHGHIIGQLTCRGILKAVKDFDVPKRYFEGR